MGAYVWRIRHAALREGSRVAVDNRVCKFRWVTAVAVTRDFVCPPALAVSQLHDALLPIDPSGGCSMWESEHGKAA